MAADDRVDPSADSAAALWLEARAAVARVAVQRGEPSRSPVARYLDAERQERERVALRAWPHAIGAAAALRAPGDWLSTELFGVPVVCVVDDGGALRAFVNVCRHRGALIAPLEGAGSGRQRFVCPYHSWTYDRCGVLVGRPHEADFPHVPRADAALVELPACRRLGLVWVVPQRAGGKAFDWDAYFGPLGAELAALGYDDAAASPHQRRFDQPSNWKLVLDANLESYHFQYAHRQTIAHLFHDNVVQQRSFGDHQRIVLPKRTLAETAAERVDWELLGRHGNVIYFFFPGTFVLWEGDHANVFEVHPLDARTCRATSWMVVPASAFERRAATHWERNWAIFWAAIDEDYGLAASMQRGLESGANEALAFGTNEFACELFERAVDELVAGTKSPPV